MRLRAAVRITICINVTCDNKVKATGCKEERKPKRERRKKEREREREEETDGRSRAATLSAIAKLCSGVYLGESWIETGS